MKKALGLALCAALLAGAGAAQDRSDDLARFRDSTLIESKADGRTGFHVWDTSGFGSIRGPRPYHIDMAAGKAPEPASGGRLGDMLWNNMAVSGWTTFCFTNYINLDWGKLQPTASGLPDEVIDGFVFHYGTNSVDADGESIAYQYYDSCTGWSNLGVHEAGFIFTGLLNGFGKPPLAPGYAWIMSVTVDLEGSGYEFLLNDRIGQGFVLLEKPATGETGVAIGYAPNCGGNGPTGTEHAFDMYRPDLTYNGTWWFCTGNPYWATWPGALCGPGDAAQGMAYYGVGAAGNEASLYATGAWTAGGSVRFFLRRNQSPLGAWLLASKGDALQYLPLYDITRLIAGIASGPPLPMANSPEGDFATLAITVSPGLAGMTVYFQAAQGDAPLLQPPIEASNGIRAN